MEGIRKITTAIEHRALEIFQDVIDAERYRAAKMNRRAARIILASAEIKAGAAAKGYADAIRGHAPNATDYREDVDAPLYYDGYSIGRRELGETLAA